MGVLRTINHPGIQINEVDASGAAEQVGGCTSLVVGFFPQGESATPVNPTSLKSVQSYFGTPENEAERYSYYACKSVFDNGGKLIAARIPYDNNSQYLTPATKYNIEEWSTAYDETYSKYSIASKYTHKFTASFTETELSYEEKQDYTVANSISISSIYPINSKTSDGKTTTEETTQVYAINKNGTTSTINDYYTLSFPSSAHFNTLSQNFSISSSTGYTQSDQLTSYIVDYTGEFASEGTSGTFTSISIYGNSKYLSSFNYTFSQTKKYYNITNGSYSATISAQYDSNNNLTGIFKLSQNGTSRADINNLIYQKTYVGSDFKFNPVAFDGGHSYGFNITKHNSPTFNEGSTINSTTASFYTESLCSNKNTDFIWDSSLSLPTTSMIKKLNGTVDGEDVMVISSYYRDGEGVKTITNTQDRFTELRIWDYSKITDITSLTNTNSAYYDIIDNTYAGTYTAITTRVSDSNFKSAPISADVTLGYVSQSGDGVTSELMKIEGTDEFTSQNQPAITEVDDPNGTGKIQVLSQLNNGTTVSFDSNNYYAFVSKYRSIASVASAKSNLYQWIHYTTNATMSASGEYEDRVLLSCMFGCETSAVPDGLSKVNSVVSITPDADNYGYIKLSDYIDYRDEVKKVDENTIVIANITEQKFGVDAYNNNDVKGGEEVLGIVPVLMSGFQALPKQSRIQLPDSITNSSIFNALETIVRGQSIDLSTEGVSAATVESVTLNKEGFVKTLGAKTEYDPYESTYSNDLLGKVPSINLNNNYKPNGNAVNQLTLAVCKLSISAPNDNKVMLTVLESFTGSLDSSAKDEGGNSVFIDNVVNNVETGSAYVKLFSNYKSSLTKDVVTRTESKKSTIYQSTQDTKATVVVPSSCGTAKWWVNDKKEFSLGFTDEQTKKYISYATMVAAVENVFDALSNVDDNDIDLIVDAGLTSIANRIKKYIDANTEATKAEYDLTFDEIKSVQDVAGWKSMAAKLITFCQTTRKDCMALIDAPRSLCVKNNAKLIDSKKTTTSKYSVDYDILPKFNYLGGLNSSYGAGFCNWILAVDDYSAKNIWMPPSIAAEGNIIYTDYNSNYWMAPAGEKRGNILWAVDVAFNPNAAQQDSIYAKNWNYAISSSGNIMTWGQKTFLSSTSSFNRINVRRLFLRLERLTRKNSKWVLFELNNQKTRNTYIDRIDPIFSNVKAMGGLYDYRIICDERNNTGNVIDSNEFRCGFYLKPSKVAEYLILTFTNVGSDIAFEECYGDL